MAAGYRVPFPATSVTLVWGCFFVRLAFYATIVPLWEGYD